MSRRRVFNHLFSLAVVVSLVLTSFLPALAQDTTIFLPITGNPGSSTGVPLGPFRTHVTVNNAYQWQVLGEIGVLLLDKGDDWATVLADDGQLEKLAKWGYRPEGTMDWVLLQAASGLHTPGMRAVGAASSALRNAQTANSTIWASADEERVTTAETGALSALRSAVAALSSAEVLAITQANDIDTDGDGLTDTQEMFWCTSPTTANSDFDSLNDGAEVVKLKQWLANELSAAPSTGKPFLGWPPQKTGCYDDDQDSVPDLAELAELGLNAGRESTDRDKFDDGQELFGTTYCTGQGGFCSYGPLPRNEDWGIIFAEMPSWVKAPGHHPLVAGFPVPEVDVVDSSLHVETVTIVTTDHTIASGTEESYSTAKTEGASTSVANSVMWNEWQEVSVATPQTLNRSVQSVHFWGAVINLATKFSTAAKTVLTYCTTKPSVPKFANCSTLADMGFRAVTDEEWEQSLYVEGDSSGQFLSSDEWIDPRKGDMYALIDALQGKNI